MGKKTLRKELEAIRARKKAEENAKELYRINQRFGGSKSAGFEENSQAKPKSYRAPFEGELELTFNRQY